MSIKLENVVLASPEQMEFIIEGMRNPMNSWEKSDTHTKICRTGFHEDRPCDPECANPNCSGSYINKGIGPNDLDLMQRLSNAGTEHRKYMRMMPVYVRITAPLYWWKEFDTYKIGTVANSCSTMHKIAAKEFTLEDFSIEKIDPYYLEQFKSLVRSLNQMRNDYNKLKSENKFKHVSWYSMIQLLPSSYNQTRNVMMNYEVLANIYRQRHSHKLDEWREFCRWIESLPYSELIIGFKEYDTVEYAKEHPDFADQIKDAVEKMTKSVPCENKYQ